MWTCPKCAAKVDPSYDVCWHCGTSQEGVEDPTFVPADLAGPVERPPLFPDLSEVGPTGSADLVECYWARDAMEAEHLAARLDEEGIPSVADTQDIRLRGVGAAVTNPLAQGNPYFGPRVRVRRGDLARATAWLKSHEQCKAK